ncbi:MAG: RNA 2'-phosphotransferase [Crocinitomicaceae bacterium]
MNPKEQIKKGRFLSLILRHNPGKIDIQLDEEGWTDVEILIRQMNKFNRNISFEELDYLVQHNPKKRYAFSQDKSRIRANQGHSVKVDLGLKPATPPDELFHGTADRFIESILNEGLVKRNRHHVHLSADIETASKVGKRHGRLVILKVDARQMLTKGFQFYISENGVWLCDHVPSQFLDTMT